MSDHPTHPESVTDLDASVDALADQLAISADAVDVGGNAEYASVATLDAPPLPHPPTSDAHSDAHHDESASTDDLLSEISDEIERTSPGHLPTPPEPPPSAYAPPAPLPSDEDIASAAAEVDADLDAFEAPSESEVPHAAPPPHSPVAHHESPAAPALQPISNAPTTERPGPEIKKLDAALAAGAERALATAKREVPSSGSPAAPIVESEHENEYEPQLPAEPLEPIIVAPATPTKHESQRAPTSVRTEEPLPELAAAPSVLRPLLINAITLPLRPIAALHEKLSEPTRQTIAYCAIITLFFAACVWGRVVFFPAKSNLEPHGEAAEFYDDTKPAHHITAPAKHAPEGAAAHGESGHGDSGGHGEAKKPDAHAKPEKKSGAHADEAHAKPEKKPAGKGKKTAAADPHGGH